MFEFLHPLYEMDGDIGASSGVEVVPAAEEQQVETSSETGADVEVAAEPEKINNYEKAFAKRLAAEREKWQSEVSEKYKDHDVYRKATEYLQKTSGINDVMSLKEQIELSELQERAEIQNLDPETLRRIEQLEAKAARVDEFEQNQQQQQWEGAYWSGINEFVKDRGIQSQELNQFMLDNGLFVDPNNLEKSFTVAYKAMRAEKLEQELSTAKESAVKEYLQSKTAPRVEGSGTPGVVHEDTSKLGWNELRNRALARINAANQST